MAKYARTGPPKILDQTHNKLFYSPTTEILFQFLTPQKPQKLKFCQTNLYVFAIWRSRTYFFPHSKLKTVDLYKNY